MRSKRPLVSTEDEAQFLAAVVGATPLVGQHRDRVPLPPAPPSRPQVAQLPPPVALTVEGNGTCCIARAPGVSRTRARSLARAELAIEQTLDLHGDTVERAIRRLQDFLLSAAGHARCILVIHGKGIHSDHGAPVRDAVQEQLLGALSGLVHAFATAPQQHGGEGATLVLLRSAAR